MQSHSVETRVQRNGFWNKPEHHSEPSYQQPSIKIDTLLNRYSMQSWKKMARKRQNFGAEGSAVYDGVSSSSVAACRRARALRNSPSSPARFMAEPPKKCR